MAGKNESITLNTKQIDALIMRNIIAGTFLKSYDENLFEGPVNLEQLNTLAAVGRAFAELTAVMKDEKAIEEATARIAMMKSATTSA